ncbi:MAG: tetratricopeptide repeat protein [Myxococcales bacterium]
MAISQTADQLLATGLAHHRQGDHKAAERCYRAVLQDRPTHTQALYLSSVIALESGRFDDAVALLESAVAQAPKQVVLWCNLGEALRRSGRLESATASLERAVELGPEHAEAHANLGLTFFQRRKWAQAAACCQLALSLNPALSMCSELLIDSLRELGEHTRACAAYERFAAANRGSSGVHVAIARVLLALGRVDAAVTHCEAALTAGPRSAHALSVQALAVSARGEATRATRLLREAIALEPANAPIHSHLVFSLMYDPAVESDEIAQEARSYQARHLRAIPRVEHSRAQDPERRLRIGYVSGDFKLHAATMFMLPLLRHHDRSEFDFHCYANVSQPDAVTEDFQALADVYRDIVALDDASAARLIRDDRVDILVDLSMHSEGHRLGVFAHKPAPVQVSWLAYPGTTGVSAIDYRLTDLQLDPAGAVEQESYTERPWHLPHSFWCYDPLVEGIFPNAPPALTAGHVTFGSLNNHRKVNDLTLTLWARVLAAVPGSRFLMLAPEGEARVRALSTFARFGVEEDRVTFVAAGMRRDVYLRTYHRIDCCLDALPFHGGTTSFDAWWMGVPVISLVGKTVVGRMGASIACNLRVTNLVAHSSEEYVACAASLARDLGELATLRKELRTRMESSVLMDASRFARELEVSYREMWRQWCLG